VNKSIHMKITCTNAHTWVVPK